MQLQGLAQSQGVEKVQRLFRGEIVAHDGIERNLELFAPLFRGFGLAGARQRIGLSAGISRRTVGVTRGIGAPMGDGKVDEFEVDLMS